MNIKRNVHRNKLRMWKLSKETTICPDDLWDIYFDRYFIIMSVADFCDNFKKDYLDGKCVKCGFDHLPDEMCREAESWLSGPGFIPYNNGLYIKPLGI